MCNSDDIVGINQYAGCCAEKAEYLDKVLDKTGEFKINKPILVSEFGG